MSKKTILLFVIILIWLFSYIFLVIKKEKEIELFNQFNQISDSQNNSGINLVKLSSSEEREIQNIIIKAFKNQWKYFYNRNESNLDDSMRNLYSKEGYLVLKEEVKLIVKRNENGYEYFTPEKIEQFAKKIKFSEFRSFKNINGKIGIIAGFSSNEFLGVNIHYFLMKKTEDNWQIEKELIPAASPFELLGKEIIIINDLSRASK